MLLHTSHQRWGYVGLCEPTGEPIEGSLVGIIPTRTSGWGKGRWTPHKRDNFTGGHHREQLCCLCNWFMFQFIFGWSLVCSECLHWVEKIVSTWSVSQWLECGWVKSFSCVLVNLMTCKDHSRGGQWCSVSFYRLCTTLPSCHSMEKPTMIMVAVQGPPLITILLSSNLFDT